jgi:hypothetical protein
MPRQPFRSAAAPATPLAALCLLALALQTAAARADEIEVDGKPISGKVVKVTPDGLEVETTYGKGNVVVPYARITQLHTDEPFAVLNGDDGEVSGRLIGVRDGKLLLVGEDEASASVVPVDTLHDSVAQKQFEESALLRLRSYLRYWSAHYDLSFAATDSTTNTLAFSTGFEVERRKKPTRFFASGSYRLATIDDPHDDPSREVTSENELLGALRGEYDLGSRYYTYAASSWEYDQVESLSLRFTPKGGLGVRLIDTEKQQWDADIGAAWVYENYFGSEDTNRYASLAFGTDGKFSLPYGSTLTLRGEYLPAVDDWTVNYLLRGSATLLFPMTDWLSFKSGVVEQYTNQPAADTARNSLTATAGLALVF